MMIKETVKELTVLGAIFGAQAKKLTGLRDALHTVTDNLTFTATDQISLANPVPSFISPGTYFRITGGGGANENVLFLAKIVGTNSILIDDTFSTVTNQSVGVATIDARLATVVNDESLAKLNSKGNTIFNVDRCTELGYGNCVGVLKKQAEHYHDAPEGLKDPFKLNFTVGDWFSADAGDTYAIDINHNLATSTPSVDIWEGLDEVQMHQVRVIDNNTLRIKVTQAGADCRFAGCVVIKA